MKKHYYIVCTLAGYTHDEWNNEVENMQVLGHFYADSKKDAIDFAYAECQNSFPTIEHYRAFKECDD